MEDDGKSTALLRVIDVIRGQKINSSLPPSFQSSE